MMKQIRYNFLFFLSIIFLTTCGNNHHTQAQVRLDAKSFKTALTKTGIQLVDVRTPNEYKVGHIKGAKLVNYYENSFRTKIAKLDKNEPVYLYCKGGIRSNRAAGICKEMGFKKVYDMKGGIDAWLRSGFPVSK